MSITFGEYDSAQGVALDNGMYDATICEVNLVMENGQPKVNVNGKKQTDVWFQVDEETKIKRRYAISFMQNTSTKAWAAFAKMLEAATGVKCGTPEQKALTDSDLVGRPVRIVVETNDRGYADVQNVLPPPKGATAAKQKPKPVAQAESTESDSTFDEIPFLADPNEFGRIFASL